uniref:Putative secreted protein n=1 Tax=Amblyomma parvum TaxID=251391 RepID=A0A023G2S7_AMBPA
MNLLAFAVLLTTVSVGPSFSTSSSRNVGEKASTQAALYAVHVTNVLGSHTSVVLVLGQEEPFGLDTKRCWKTTYVNATDGLFFHKVEYKDREHRTVDDRIHWPTLIIGVWGNISVDSTEAKIHIYRGVGSLPRLLEAELEILYAEAKCFLVRHTIKSNAHN